MKIKDIRIEQCLLFIGIAAMSAVIITKLINRRSNKNILPDKKFNLIAGGSVGCLEPGSIPNIGDTCTRTVNLSNGQVRFTYKRLPNGNIESSGINLTTGEPTSTAILYTHYAS